MEAAKEGSVCDEDAHLDWEGKGLCGLNVTRLSAALGNRPRLCLSSNQLTTIQPDAATALKHVTHLYLASNQLREFPHALIHLEQLMTLDLSENRLQDIPLAASAFTALRDLNLDGNSFRTLPACVWALHRLQRLAADSNRLKHLDPVADGDDVPWPQLRALELRKNLLEHVPAVIGRLPCLESVLLRGNRIKCLDGHVLAQATSLQRLDVGDNHVHELPMALYHMVSLRKLDVCYNRFTTFPEVPKDTTSPLEKLVANNCRLESLPESMRFLPRLKYLNVAHNSIASIPSGFFALAAQTLTRLKLDHNQLSSIPPLPIEDPKYCLHTVDIRHNTISYEDMLYLMEMEKQGRVDLCHFEDTVPQRVVPGIYLGSSVGARNVQALQKCNITHILNIAQKHKHRHFPSEFTYRVLDLDDTVDERLRPAFESSHVYMNEAIEAGGGVLIHCLAGISRSCAIVISWLMRFRRMRYEEALAFLLTKRKEAAPNPGFVQQLKMYEEELFGKV